MRWGRLESDSRSRHLCCSWWSIEWAYLRFRGNAKKSEMSAHNLMQGAAKFSNLGQSGLMNKHIVKHIVDLGRFTLSPADSPSIC
jgi:hypothetical protein